MPEHVICGPALFKLCLVFFEFYEFLDYFLAEVTKTYLSVGRHCIRN